MNKSLTTIIAIMLFLTTTPFVFAFFTDVPTSNQFSEAINYAQENNIVEGYEDGTFKPENLINRAEFSKIVINFSLTADNIYGENCFPDVRTEWFAKYICTAKRLGIVEGYDDGLFHPKDNITLTQAGKIIIESLDYESPRDPTIWYEPYMQTLSGGKAIPITISKINEQITRGEMIEIIWRLVENITNKESMNYQNNGLSTPTETPSVTWWKPTPGTTWQWQLTGNINTTYDVDMYDIDLEKTPQKTIDKLHSKNKKVICYFSAGSYEEFRSDAEDFPEEVLGDTLEGWEDEKWLDVSQIDLLAPIMENRLDLAVEKKCDGVEPDNMDGYDNDSGFNLTYKDQVAYSKWIATEAHKRNLSVGLKNGLKQVKDVISYFDFAVNEQCFEYEECDELQPFIDANKAVFGVEYELDTDEFCDQASEMEFSWLKMDYDLDGGRISC